MYELARCGLYTCVVHIGYTCISTHACISVCTEKNKCMSWHVVGCMWVRRRIYHNGAPAPAVMDARHRHTALHYAALYKIALYNTALFHDVLHCTVLHSKKLYFVL